MDRKEKMEMRKKQLLCIAAGFLLGGLALLTAEEGKLKTDSSGSFLDRPGYGEAGTGVELEAEDDAGNRESFSLQVSGRVYTKEEAREIFAEMLPEVWEIMLGENKGLDQIRTDLSFPESLEKWPGVSLEWSGFTGSLIEEDGKVNNADLNGAQDITLSLRLSAGGEELETDVIMTVLPAPERISEIPWSGRLQKELQEINANTRTGDRLTLPSEFEEHALTFSEPKDYTFLLFPALGLLAAVLVSLLPKEEEKKKKKERETELLIDYSELVSKLIVYIGAGLTVRNAFAQLAESYRQTKGPVRAVYEEILVADRDLENGETESRAYMNFARRCELKCYVRMVSLLEQNRKTGDSALLTALELEMEEAFEQRKNVARRLGEEAGTKLMAPLMISLVTVMIVVVVPAVLTMG